MNTILPMILAPAVSIITAGLEKAPGVPYQAKSKASVTACLLGVSIAVRFAVAAFQGELSTLDLGQDLQLFGEAALTALAGAGGYSLVKNDKPVI